MKMTTEEAFVKVLQMHGIDNAFGIIGSAMMPISDLFPKAGITFWDCAHETNAGLICDGFSRATGKIAMAIAQNGPGVTGFVTAIKTAYWNHTPMLLVTPQAANKTIGQGGFQEVANRWPMFRGHGLLPGGSSATRRRMAEVLNRVIEKAIRGSAPAQINIPRDYWTQVIDIELPPIVRLERSGGRPPRPSPRPPSCCPMPSSRSSCRVPAWSSATRSRSARPWPSASARRSASGYQHNDSFPGSHPLAAGPLGYNGSKAAMELISKADVVLGPGHPPQSVSRPCPVIASTTGRRTRRSSRSTSTADRIGLTKKVTVRDSVVMRNRSPSRSWSSFPSHRRRCDGRQERLDLIASDQVALGSRSFTSMDHEDDDPGHYLERSGRAVLDARPDERPGMAWRAIQAGPSG